MSIVRIAFSISVELARRIEEYIKKQDVPPSRSQVIATAIKKFLDDEEEKCTQQSEN